MEEYIIKDGKRLRLGYTTGSCAAAAAKAACFMLLTGRRKETVELLTPKGILLTLSVLEITQGPDFVSCAIRKDSGDDPDVTNGIEVFVTLSVSDRPGIAVCGGVGVGRITKPGLQMPVGEAAINLVPRRMIREQIEQVRQSYPQWESVGLRALVEIPQGVQLAAKTYNPRLGIEGGISVLGTSGIVEPMSEQALTDSIRLELSILQKQGHRCVLITPGNYGKAFLSGETIGGKSDFHALAQMADRAVKCSNFVGDTLDMCVQQGFSHALLVGHIGKFSKLAAGVMNTHSRYADARLEVFTAHAALAGAYFAAADEQRHHRRSHCLSGQGGHPAAGAALDLTKNTGPCAGAGRRDDENRGHPLFQRLRLSGRNRWLPRDFAAGLTGI